MSVYIVTTGEYDGFDIHSIWSTLEAAQEAARGAAPAGDFWGDRTRLITAELDSLMPEGHRDQYFDDNPVAF